MNYDLVLADDVNVCLNDVDVEHFLKIYALLYADDTVVLVESAEELQLPLNAVHDYYIDWNLTMNAAKTKVVNDELPGISILARLFGSGG